tara:strand:+ start:976 stop:1278 length:303 start_codon:yes stop_codon:yes gene_type:complete
MSSPETDTVEYVEAYLHGIDENGKNTTQPFTFKPEIPESYSGNFINYNDLTEEQVITWVTSQVPEQRIKEIEEKIEKKIASSYAAADVATEITYKSPVPW